MRAEREGGERVFSERKFRATREERETQQTFGVPLLLLCMRGERKQRERELRNEKARTVYANMRRPQLQLSLNEMEKKN